jgi:hypothetical protein
LCFDQTAHHPREHESQGELLGYSVNAPKESFSHTWKTELVMHCDYKTRDQARASLFEYMEVFTTACSVIRRSATQRRCPLKG